MSSITPTSLNTYAAALHECADKVGRLDWNKAKDKEQIVTHLKTFIDKACPGGDKNLVNAIAQLQKHILDENPSAQNYGTLTRIQQDVSSLQKHITNGDILHKLSNQSSILANITAIFGSKDASSVNQQSEIDRCNAQFAQINNIMKGAKREFGPAYFAEQSQKKIDFLRNYDDVGAEEFQRELDASPAKAERLHEKLVEKLAKNMNTYLTTINEELADPQSIGLVTHISEDVAFLKDCINTDAFAGKIDLSQSVVAIFAKEDLRRKVQDLKPFALQALTKIEQTI